MDAIAATILGVSGGGIWLLDKMLGPAANAVGEGIAAPVIAWKERRLVLARGVLERASEDAAASGLEIHSVPGRVLWPILEKSSLEDDEGLRRTWSRLLASAATDTPGTEVPPAFPSILGELSPIEAVVMERLHAPQKWGEPYAGHEVHAWYYAEELAGKDRARVVVDNFVRLRLLDPPLPRLHGDEVAKTIARMIQSKGDAILNDLPMRPGHSEYRLTSLGVALAKACNGPATIPVRPTGPQSNL